MNLPTFFSRFFNKTSSKKEAYVAIILDPSYVSACIWDIGDRDIPFIYGHVTLPLRHDTWEDRIDVADKAIAQIEDSIPDAEINSVLLGLSSLYTTPAGDIRKEVRMNIKYVTTELELKPLGYVPIHIAISHYLKHTEGIPPTAILLGFSGNLCTLTLFRVGKMAGQREFSTDGNISNKVDEALRSFQDVEVLPSRILLFGGNQIAIEEYKQELMGYPWQQKANFLHFPKIDSIPERRLITAVAYAGSSELSESAVMPDEVDKDSEILDENFNEAPLLDDQNKMETFKKDISDIKSNPTVDTALDKPTIEDKILDQEKQVQKPKEVEDEESESLDSQNSLATEYQKETATMDENLEEEDIETYKKEHANIVNVNPKILGFHQNVDINNLAGEPFRRKLGQSKNRNFVNLWFYATRGALSKIYRKIKSKITFPTAWYFSKSPIQFKGRLNMVVTACLGVGVLIILWLLFTILLPRVNVTIYALPQKVEGTIDVNINTNTIDTEATQSAIPGTKREQTQSGETTIAVTGSKDVGDPAKGGVTLYNKITDKRIIKKGTVLVSGSLEFSLDNDVDIASASESIGSITFGKGQGSITASQIGPQSNLPAGTDFTVKGVSVSSLTARNDTALTGGTSRKVTVVSRADQNTLVETLTKQLIEKAKTELVDSVSGSEVLIDDTIQTSVSEKKFNQELNQETTQLSGSVTVVITGISYSKKDLESFVLSRVKPSISIGYEIDPTQMVVDIKDITVNKNTIKGIISYDCTASPSFVLVDLKRQLSGKTQKEAQDFLKSVNGVAGVDFRYKLSPFSSRLPRNSNNISIQVVPQKQ